MPMGIISGCKKRRKLIKAHCLPTEWTLNSLSPWWILAQRNKAILTWFLREMFVYFADQNKKFAYYGTQFNIFLALPPSVPPRNYDILTDGQTQIEISTIHRSARKTGSSELWRNLHVKIRSAAFGSNNITTCLANITTYLVKHCWRWIIFDSKHTVFINCVLII
jgi:hypothetical protein